MQSEIDSIVSVEYIKTRYRLCASLKRKVFRYCFETVRGVFTTQAHWKSMGYMLKCTATKAAVEATLWGGEK